MTFKVQQDDGIYKEYDSMDEWHKATELERRSAKLPLWIWYRVEDYLYHPIYMFVRWIIWEPVFEPIRLRSIKWFLERGKRGWAECDVWAVDEYLCWIMPPMLKRLKEIQHGIPNHREMDENKWTEEKAIEEWNKIIDKIIGMFELERKQMEWKELTEDEKILKAEGWLLFQKWFGALWD